MDPIDLTTEDVAFLPPHTLVVYAKDQPEYRPLPGARLEGREGRFLSRWTLTTEERARIAAGEDFYLQILTFGDRLQPLLPTVGVPDLCPRD